jgi:serine/threonine-protein kinase HipA
MNILKPTIIISLSYMDEQGGYNREKVEYGYHLLTQAAGIEMMECVSLTKHFATLRYDRQHGQKQHVLIWFDWLGLQ